MIYQGYLPIATISKITATDIPNFSTVTNMQEMFRECQSITEIPNIDKWSVGKVTDMSQMFFNASSFNGDLSKWNTSKVTRMDKMFQNATSFNQDISRWDVRQVYDMRSMFNGATSFNQNLERWVLKDGVELKDIFTNSGMSPKNTTKFPHRSR